MSVPERPQRGSLGTRIVQRPCSRPGCERSGPNRRSWRGQRLIRNLDRDIGGAATGSHCDASYLIGHGPSLGSGHARP